MQFSKLTTALFGLSLSVIMVSALPVSSAMAADGPAAAVAGSTMRVHYHRAKNDTSNWGVYSWQGPKEPSKTWISDRFMFDKTDDFGGYVDIAMDAKKTEMKLLVTNSAGHKNCSSDQSVKLVETLATTGQEIWVLESDCTIHSKAPAL